NGQKVPLYTSSTSSIGPGDYIEFYGKHNIGDLENVLYQNDTMQPHIYYSLFNDTSIYYLTISTNPSPRYTKPGNNLINLPPKETYSNYATRQFYTSTYIAGQY